MNKILKSFLIIGLGLGIFTACDDDRDSNPTLISPTEFVLNTPAISGTVIDLANSSSIEISCSQPDYGFPELKMKPIRTDKTNQKNDK
jgi:hypothetical protein